MPVLEIQTVNVPKDLNSFNVRINAIFAKALGKPHEVSVLSKRKRLAINPIQVVYGHLQQGRWSCLWCF